MESSRADHLIEIIGDEIPVAPGSQTYEGFKNLRASDGNTYQSFRDLAGGSKGSNSRQFSPSTVMRKAEKAGFARLRPASSGNTADTRKIFHEGDEVKRSENAGVSIPYSKQYGMLTEAAFVMANEGVDAERPGIYAWEIEGVGVYIGRYTRSNRPLGEYDKNVSRLLRGEAYRPNKPDGFRAIHRALAEAVQSSRRVILRLVENCRIEDLDSREQYWISTLGQGDLNG